MGKVAVDVMIRLFGRPFVTLAGVPTAAFPSSGFLILALCGFHKVYGFTTQQRLEYERYRAQKCIATRCRT